ncbi:hypothetical protein F5Y16DRAFT_163694 [Xylariaceae sp. FL0255]|nr:hypothetical protein F5Y16DRAFT_163694 [Xylariaceae sp. FL0255]
MIHRPLGALILLCLLGSLFCCHASHIPNHLRHRHVDLASAPNRPSLWSRFVSHLYPSSSSASPRTSSSWLRDHPRIVESLKEYEDQVVIRFSNVSTPQLEDALRKVIDRMLLDVWHFSPGHVDIRMPARRVQYLIRALPEPLRDAHSVMIPDLARAIAATYPSTTSDSHRPHQSSPKRDLTYASSDGAWGLVDVFFERYQPLSVMVAWMRLLDSMYDGRGIVQMISIGTSFEGREIPGLRVGIRDPSTPTRDAILITGGIHAREWISTSTVNYVAWSFIRSIDNDPMVHRILTRFDLIFVPVLNPDGYEYTWEVDRLWRKSRQRTKMSVCPGFDLDHAFGYQWDATDHQTEPCSQSYGGDEPFQAVEAAQLADWAKNETAAGTTFAGYLDLHSYSQQVLVPFAYSCGALPPNMEKLTEVAMNLAKHLRLSNGEIYTVASACEGAATYSSDITGRHVEARGGSAIDYVFHELHAHYSYQIKLRDTGSYGFLLPGDQIIPTGEEVLQAMKYLGDYLLGNDGHEGWQLSEMDGQQLDTIETEDEIKELRKRRRNGDSDEW